jgi:hypothetical protein
VRIAIRLAPLIGLTLAGCADKPTVDQIAQLAMIGLSNRDILVCIGEPVRKRWVAQATEIWTYPVGVTTTETPPWGGGLNFAASSSGPLPCDVKLVMTNEHVSQVAYSLPDGRALPTGRQCAFVVQACALRREQL